jgi:drug/metabolite transporter (DMT)-like permease
MAIASITSASIFSSWTAPRMPRLHACIYLACAMLMTGANVPIGKVVVATLPVYAFTFLRFAAASLLLAFLASRETGPRLNDLAARDWLGVGAMSLFGMVLYTVFILEGVKRTSGVDAGIILATLPAVVALLGALFLRERPRALQLLAVAMAAGGVALILTREAPPGAGAASSLLGDLLVGAAVLGEAAFVVLSRRLSGVLSPLRLALAGSVCACALSLPLALASGDLGRLGAVPLMTWILAGWYTLSASILCLWLWYRGVGYVETWMAGVCTACLPLAALAVSVFALGEPLTWTQAAGAGLVVTAILVGSVVSGRSR